MYRPPLRVEVLSYPEYGGTGVSEPDPGVIETLVVKPAELVTAVEATVREEPSVLRMTAPFSARMRARLHVKQPGDGDDPDQVLVDPADLLTASAPEYPHPDETEDRLRSSSDPYSVERHREMHEAAIESWRQRVTDHVVDAITHPAAGEVEVSVLATDDPE